MRGITQRFYMLNSTYLLYINITELSYCQSKHNEGKIISKIVNKEDQRSFFLFTSTKG